MVKIPPEYLSEAALRGVIEAFVLREGTDYGPAEHDLDEKCRAVERQLRGGVAEICFDPVSGTTDIRTVTGRS
ncbi:MAG: YheU family protein [Pseudomonadales bacterium]|nr:YheU family protein [Pseudomonadales bacterium]